MCRNIDWHFYLQRKEDDTMAKKSDRPPGRRIKRGRLHFSEDEAADKSGPSTSGQVGPKPQEHREIQAGRGTGKAFLPPAFRDRQTGDDNTADAATENTGQEERTAAGEKKSKQEKRFEKAPGQGGTRWGEAERLQGKAGCTEASKA